MTYAHIPLSQLRDEGGTMRRVAFGVALAVVGAIGTVVNLLLVDAAVRAWEGVSL